jgi:hypothetical protein
MLIITFVPKLAVRDNETVAPPVAVAFKVYVPAEFEVPKITFEKVMLPEDVEPEVVALELNEPEERVRVIVVLVV